jgi:hypothetical protein
MEFFPLKEFLFSGKKNPIFYSEKKFLIFIGENFFDLISGKNFNSIGEKNFQFQIITISELFSEKNIHIFFGKKFRFINV